LREGDSCAKKRSTSTCISHLLLGFRAAAAASLDCGARSIQLPEQLMWFWFICTANNQILAESKRIFDFAFLRIPLCPLWFKGFWLRLCRNALICGICDRMFPVLLYLLVVACTSRAGFRRLENQFLALAK
jgi:hypothetical protein